MSSSNSGFTPESRYQRDEWRRQRQQIQSPGCLGTGFTFLVIIVVTCVVAFFVLRHIFGSPDTSISHADVTLKVGDRIEVPSGDVIKGKPRKGTTTFVVSKAGIVLDNSTPTLYTAGVDNTSDPCNFASSPGGKGTITLPWGDVYSRGSGLCMVSGTKGHMIDTRVHFKGDSLGPTSKITLTSWNRSE